MTTDRLRAGEGAAGLSGPLPDDISGVGRWEFAGPTTPNL